MTNPRKLWTRCKNGHPFNEENTLIEYVKGVKNRRCKICRDVNKKIWDKTMKLHINARQRKYWPIWSQKIRKQVLTHYSNGKLECACCGENTYQFLTLDHINNNGQQERKLYKNQLNIYLRLIKIGFPEGYQTLCWNCNLGKRSNKGTCPHKTHMPRIPITVEWQS